MTEEFIPKRIIAYTDAELLTLTEEQINMIIDLECAYKGVQLLPEHPKAIEKPDDIYEDLMVYKMPSFLCIQNVEELEKLMSYINGIIKHIGKVNYISGPSYKHEFSSLERPITLSDFESQSAYSAEKLEAVGFKLKKYEIEKKKYDDQKNEYDKIAKGRKGIADELYNKISNCMADEREYERMKAIAKRYMKLAGGVQEIATNFMVDAYKENEEMIRENFGAWVVDFVTEKMTEGDSANG